MAKLHRSAALGPAASVPIVKVNVVARPATDVKLFSARIERDPVEGVWHLKHLRLDRLAAGNIKHKDIFVGFIGICVALVRAGREILAVVTAGKNQQRVSVRTDCGGHRLPNGKAWIKRQSRIQGLER